MKITTALMTASLLTMASLSPILTSVTFPSASAQSSALTAQADAQTILNKALKVAGGYDALQSFRNVQITFSVRTANPGQAPTPTKNPALGNASKNIVYRANGMTAAENYNGDNLGFRYVRGNGSDWVYLAGQNAVANIDPLFAPGILDRVTTSADILLTLSDNSEALRSGGNITIENITYNVIHFADSIGRAQTLYFNADTNQLASAETLSAHAQWGDISTVTSFADHKEINGVSIAHTTKTKQAGILTQVTTIDAISFDNADPAIFSEPENVARNDPFTVAGNTPRTLNVEELGKNIFFIPNAAQGYNVIFVNNRDGITIIETPQTPQAARDIIKTISARLPGKKIKRAVPTHHHFDHSGGLYGFLEAGIPVLTTPGNEEFVREIGTAARNIGRNQGTPEKVQIDTFEKKRTIGRGSRKIELYNVGPNPHAAEIVVAYLPAVKSLLVADIFSARGETIPPANANQLAFADVLEQLDLDIDTFIPVHGRKATAEEFWDSVKRGREAQSLQSSG